MAHTMSAPLFLISNPSQSKNYCTISLIYHPSKVMQKVLLNRLKLQAETIIVEEQAGFRAGRSTTEQIFSLGILCERYLKISTRPLSGMALSPLVYYKALHN